mmetsp:Transcript_11144/g.27327  ORF Transcript_11144/g.27327 Transcript_11144/m.27327 type:complete len:303 (-) Transcript_11144:3488-4396(-)
MQGGFGGVPTSAYMAKRPCLLKISGSAPCCLPVSAAYSRSTHVSPLCTARAAASSSRCCRSRSRRSSARQATRRNSRVIVRACCPCSSSSRSNRRICSSCSAAADAAAVSGAGAEAGRNSVAEALSLLTRDAGSGSACARRSSTPADAGAAAKCSRHIRAPSATKASASSTSTGSTSNATRPSASIRAARTHRRPGGGNADGSTAMAGSPSSIATAEEAAGPLGAPGPGPSRATSRCRSAPHSTRQALAGSSRARPSDARKVATTGQTMAATRRRTGTGSALACRHSSALARSTWPAASRAR